MSVRDVIWLRPEGSPSGRPAGLTRDQITQAAVALADREGLEAVTMRSLAAELGTGAATLYRHLRTRDDLIDLMSDHVASLYTFPEPGGEPVDDMVAFCDEIRRVMRQHLWMTGLTQLGSRVGPRQSATIEHALRVLEPAPGSHADHLETFSTVVGITAMWLHNELLYSGDSSPNNWMTHVVATGQFPLTTMAMVETWARYEHGRDEHLRRILRGVITGLLGE